MRHALQRDSARARNWISSRPQRCAVPPPSGLRRHRSLQHHRPTCRQHIDRLDVRVPQPGWHPVLDGRPSHRLRRYEGCQAEDFGPRLDARGPCETHARVTGYGCSETPSVKG